jgi:hypothetical protein
VPMGRRRTSCAVMDRMRACVFIPLRICLYPQYLELGCQENPTGVYLTSLLCFSRLSLDLDWMQNQTKNISISTEPYRRRRVSLHHLPSLDCPPPRRHIRSSIRSVIDKHCATSNLQLSIQHLRKLAYATSPPSPLPFPPLDVWASLCHNPHRARSFLPSFSPTSPACPPRSIRQSTPCTLPAYPAVAFKR